MGNIYEKYHERGLDNYKLKSLEDIKAIYGFYVPTMKGYEDLSTDNQEVVNKFLINFFNAQGMDRRSTIKPLQVNYVMETYYSRPSVENIEDINTYEVVAREFKKLSPKGRYTKFLLHQFYDDVDFTKCKASISYFLRIDYKWGTRKEWLHIIKPDQWY